MQNPKGKGRGSLFFIHSQWIIIIAYTLLMSGRGERCPPLFSGGNSACPETWGIFEPQTRASPRIIFPDSDWELAMAGQADLDPSLEKVGQDHSGSRKINTFHLDQSSKR